MWQGRITLRPGARGPAVADVRWRLVRLGYLPVAPAGQLATAPDTGGRAGDCFDQALQEAVRAFQASQGLSADGIVGPATWGRLYTLTSPNCPAWRPEQPAPPAYACAAVAALASSSSRACSPWAPPPAEAPAARIEVHLAERRLVLYTPSGAAAFPAAVGRPDAPTPAGRYNVAELIPYPGPPLGTRWIRLEPDLCSIHGTDEPWLVGDAVTPGCLRLYNKDVEFVFHRVAVGTPVEIYA